MSLLDDRCAKNICTCTKYYWMRWERQESRVLLCKYLRERDRERVCVCVCVCVRVCVDDGSATSRGTSCSCRNSREREREYLCVKVCVCMCLRAKDELIGGWERQKS